MKNHICKTINIFTIRFPIHFPLKIHVFKFADYNEKTSTKNNLRIFSFFVCKKILLIAFVDSLLFK